MNTITLTLTENEAIDLCDALEASLLTIIEELKQELNKPELDQQGQWYVAYLSGQIHAMHSAVQDLYRKQRQESEQ
jgi:hypothetical protein